jgi:hypothetical protein
MIQSNITKDSAHAIGALMFQAAYDAYDIPNTVCPDWRAHKALASVIRQLTRPRTDHLPPASRWASVLDGAAQAACDAAPRDWSSRRSLEQARMMLERLSLETMNDEARTTLKIIIFEQNDKTSCYVHLDPTLCEDVGQFKYVATHPFDLMRQLQEAYPGARIVMR